MQLAFREARAEHVDNCGRFPRVKAQDGSNLTHICVLSECACASHIAGPHCRGGDVLSLLCLVQHVVTFNMSTLPCLLCCRLLCAATCRVSTRC